MIKLAAYAMMLVITASCSWTANTEPSLEGKSVAFVGDSICYGTNYRGGYAEIIGEQENMIVTNSGKGGAAVARGVKWSDGGDGVRPSILDMVLELDGDYNYIIIEGGVNDFWNHAPLGSLTDGYDGDFDDTTFAGALEAMFAGIGERHADSKAGYIIIHDPFTYDAEDGFEPYYEMIKSACDKWSVPYLDLYAANNAFAGVNVKDEEQKRLYFETENAPNGDGCHPNEAGYREIYVKPMTLWLKTL